MANGSQTAARRIIARHRNPVIATSAPPHYLLMNRHDSL
jgi:hypothetical protein